MWWSVAAAGLGAYGAVGKFLGGQESASMQRAQTREQLRRLEGEFLQRRGQAEAIGSGSGFEYSSESLQRHLTGMTDEFRRQADYLRATGYARARATERSSVLGLFGDLGTTLFQFGQSNNWFQDPTQPKAENNSEPTRAPSVGDLRLEPPWLLKEPQSSSTYTPGWWPYKP